MFRTLPATEPAAVLSDELIALSMLRLELPDLDTASLAGRDDVAIVLDDIGRAAISRDAAKMLIAERREREARRAEFLAAADAAAIEHDRQWRAQIGAGIPASSLPLGMTYAEAAQSAELDSHAYQPRRRTMAEDLFDNSGTLVFHPTISQPDQE